MNDDTLARARSLKAKLNALRDLNAEWWNRDAPCTMATGDKDNIEVDAKVWADAVHAICADINAKRQAVQAEFDAL